MPAENEKVQLAALDLQRALRRLLPANVDLPNAEEAFGDLERLMRRLASTGAGTSVLGPPDLVAKARALYRERIRRNAVFGTEHFGEPAWDVLLDLYVSRAEDRQVSVSSACIASNVPPTTALRWLVKLEAAKLIVRHSDERDQRRSFLTLSAEAISMMETYLRDVARV
jgi:DNA-binding MarR family transcriptional regulator